MTVKGVAFHRFNYSFFKTEEASREEMQLRFGASAKAAAEPFVADPFAEAQARWPVLERL